MENFIAMLSHLEHLDGQLAPAVACPDQNQGKLVKEVLLTRHQIRQYVQRNSHLLQGKPASGQVNTINSGSAYNIDTINKRFLNSVICPRCDTADVAVIKQVASHKNAMTYDTHHNRRLKLIFEDNATSAGRFSCNNCLTRFDPPLPTKIVKLCELLFTYY